MVGVGRLVMPFLSFTVREEPTESRRSKQAEYSAELSSMAMIESPLGLGPGRWLG